MSARKHIEARVRNERYLYILSLRPDFTSQLELRLTSSCFILSGLKISITVAVNAYTNNKDLGQTAHPSDLLSGQHVTFRYRLEPRESYNSV